MFPDTCFLSVDIDYYNHVKCGEVRLKEYLDLCFQASEQQSVPIVAIDNHHQILPIVNKSKARTLVNIDTHSDLGDRHTEQLNCGTWVSYVKWRQNGHYYWVHKGDVHLGECSCHDPIFTKKRHKISLTEWRKLRRICDTPPNPLALNLTEIVVCRSPSYSKKELLPVFDTWVRGVAYIRGQKSDDEFSKRWRPEELDQKNFKCSWFVR
jgi:hypothetical protein